MARQQLGADPTSPYDAATKRYVDFTLGKARLATNWNTVGDGLYLLDGSNVNIGSPVPDGILDGYMTTVTYGNWVDPQPVNEWRFQTCFGLPWDGSATRYFGRSKFQGVWSPWSELASDKAPLLSPALSGTPTAPTPVTTDNSTKIATTAFVKLVSTKITVGTTAPTSPAVGDLWVDTN